MRKIMKKSLDDWKDLASKELKDRSIDELNWGNS